MDDILKTAKEAAAKGAQIAIDVRQSGDLQIAKKGVLDLVTRADLAVNDAVQQIIRREFPDHAILSEESIQAGPPAWDKPLWILDPIDGTTNFAHGQTHVGISIAYAEHGKVQVGVVSAPFLHETYSAVRGRGATCNDQPIAVSNCETLKNALVATGFPYERDDLELIIRRVQAVLKNCRDIRRLGACSIDVCWVACGRLDAYYETVSVWDMAAATLIAEEAGALRSHINPKPASDPTPAEFYARDLVISTPRILSDIMSILK